MKTGVTWEADAHHATLVQPRFVLVGDPGSGKSTFLRHLALCWAGETLRHGNDAGAPADAGLHALAGWSGPAYTPVYVELRALIAGEAWSLEQAADARRAGAARASAARSWRAEGCEAFTDELFDLLRAGRAAILLDGLDEVNQAADPRRRAQVQAFVGELAGQFRRRADHHHRAALCLWAGRLAAARFRPHRVDAARPATAGRPGGPPLRRAGGSGSPVDATARQEMRPSRRRWTQIPADLAGNPLLLTLLMAIWLKTEGCDRCLPSTRGELYRRGLDLLLEDWVRQKVEGFSLEQGIRPDRRRSALRAAAGGPAGAEAADQADEIAMINQGEIFKAFESIGQGDIAAGLLRHLRATGGDAAGGGRAVAGHAGSDLRETVPLPPPFLPGVPGGLRVSLPGRGRAALSSAGAGPTAASRCAGAGVTQAPALWANVLRLATDELLYQNRAPTPGSC